MALFQTEISYKFMIKSSKYLFFIAVILFACSAVSCGHKQQTTFSEDSLTTEKQAIEDTLHYDEMSSLTSTDELLALETEVYYGQIDEEQKPTKREEMALSLANRVVTMYTSVDYSIADNVWLWAEAVEQVVRQYAKDNKMKYDTAVYDLHEALSYYGYDIQTQLSMNERAYYLTVIQTYDAAVRYQRLIDHIADPRLKTLVRAEYNAWFEWMDAQYFTNTYYTHGNDHYSALPLDFWAFHKYHTDNRLATLDIEEDVLVEDKPYQQKGKTVTGKQWRTWLDKQGYREEMSPEFNMHEPLETDFPALIKDKTEKWIAARQAVAQYLGDKKGKGQSYDFITADIHSCIIGKLKPLIKMELV